MDGSPCLPGKTHDHIPEPANPRYPDIRTARCRHCGHVITVTNPPT